MASTFPIANKGMIFFALTLLFSSSLRSDAASTSARLQPGQVGVLTRGQPNGVLTAKLTDGEVLMSFVLEPFPSDGGKAGVKGCQLSFDGMESRQLLGQPEIKIEFFGKEIIADLVDACNKISLWGGVQGIGSRISLPKNIVSAFSSSESYGVVVPGTLWCGWGDNAEHPGKLGETADVDFCCRDHDLCPYDVKSFQTRDHYWNSRPHTVSLCDCDNQFFDCLKGVKENKTVANVMGAFFFNTVGPPCVKKEFGKYCKKWHWSLLWCQETAEGMAAIPYSYLDKKWNVANSVQEVLEKLKLNQPTAIPPV